MVGTTISHYKVIEKIGQGGMGEVYRATDTKLNRDVALKILPEQFASDSQRMGRFQREAKVLASLDHPNIGQIYGIEEAGQTKALVLQLIEGPTLADKIAQGPIPVEETLRIALQIAEGLEAAHEKGVIHRDLKPANIKITPEGQVKILDFGLAKALEDEVVPEDISQSPTLTNAATQAGVVLGTAAYMSPEQAKGKPVDKRADIFAFGAVLYECLTGKRAFEGEDVSDTLAAVLRAEVEWGKVEKVAPSPIVRLLRRSLERNQRNRLQHIGDARLEIADSIAGTSVEEGGGANRLPRVTASALGLVVVALVGAFIAGGLFQSWVSPAPDTALPAAFSINLPINAPLALDRGIPSGFDMRLFDISPDGTRLVYVADRGSTTQLYITPVGDFGAVPLSGTEGATSPFFSPDGEWVGYVSGGELRKVSLAGGRPETVFQASGAIWGAAWDEDAIYLVDGTGTRLQRVPADGGAPVEIGRAHSVGFQLFWPVATLPEGRGVVVAASRLASGDYRDILVWSPDSNEWHTVLEAAGYDARYAPSGHLVYARAGGLRAVPFDLERLEVTGEPKLILEDVRVDAVFNYAQFAFSDTGTLVYMRGGDAGVGVPTWVDRRGNTDPIDMDPEVYGIFALSPDGRQLAIQVTGPTDQVWIYNVATGNGRRLTNEGYNGWPIWAPDGERVVFSSTRSGSWGLYVQSADGSGEAVELFQSDSWVVPYSWSPREDLIAFTKDDPLVGALLSVERGRDPALVSYPQTALEWGHRFSPDGRWIAYASDRDGAQEVWVRPFPELEPEYKVSAGGGQEPIWSHEGSELFYRNGNQWMATDVPTDPSFSVSPPRELFRTTFVDTYGVSWDLAPDGRFLVIKPIADDSDPAELRIVLNWFDELRRLVPTE